MRVKVQIDECDLENDQGYEIESVCAECTRCHHQTESFGQSEASRKRCLVLMREECPRHEKNFYVDIEEVRDEE